MRCAGIIRADVSAFRDRWCWQPLFAVLGVATTAGVAVPALRVLTRIAHCVFGADTGREAAVGDGADATSANGRTNATASGSNAVGSTRADASTAASAASGTPRGSSKSRKRRRGTAGRAEGGGSSQHPTPAEFKPPVYDAAAVADAVATDAAIVARWAPRQSIDDTKDQGGDDHGVPLVAPVAVVCGVEVPSRCTSRHDSSETGLPANPDATGMAADAGGATSFVPTPTSRANLRKLALGYLSVSGRLC